MRPAPLGRVSLIPPLPTVGRAEEVVHRLGEAIGIGLFRDGEQLPVEAELAAQMGVSPMTLREALSTLRDLGLVETRRGRHGGTFVRRATMPEREARRRLTAISVSELRDLADEHVAVSGHAAQLAAERATGTGLRRLVTFVEQLDQATEVGARIRADSRFHIEVAVASDSQRLTRREVALQSETASLLWLPLGGDNDVEAAVSEHHDIFTAIAEEDGERARQLMQRHIQRNLRRLTGMHLQLTESKDASDDE